MLLLQPLNRLLLLPLQVLHLLVVLSLLTLEDRREPVTSDGESKRERIYYLLNLQQYLHQIKKQKTIRCNTSSSELSFSCSTFTGRETSFAGSVLLPHKQAGWPSQRNTGLTQANSVRQIVTHLNIFYADYKKS